VTKSEINMMVPLSVEETRGRILACADKYGFDPLGASRAAGSRPFIVEERGERIAISRRSWLPDPYGLEADVELTVVPPDKTSLHGTLRIPTARRVITAVLLVIFVGLPLLALGAPAGVNRSSTLVMLALSVTLLIILPLALRAYRKDDQHLVGFLRACLLEFGTQS
jgi:hypothetical protein